MNQGQRSMSVCSESDDEDKTPEEILLYSARHGDINSILKLLERKKQGEIELSLDCRGVNKANLGWTPLHLASYFGHTEVVGTLLENGVNVNVQNDSGDTSLHRAAYTGRLDSVMLLLKNNADVNVRNMEGHLPKQVAKTKEIGELIEAAETCELKKKEEEFLRIASVGDADKLLIMLKGPNPPNVNCTDNFGNTALHCAAYKSRKQVAVVLLQNGIDTTVKNHKGQLALDMAKDNQTKQIVDVKPMKELVKTVDRYEGPLMKKGRIRGWKPFWVVVDRGVLSIFKTRADATTGTHRKGCKYLDRGRVECSPGEGHIFSIFYADGSTHTYSVESNLTSTINRQKWVNALSNHIAFASQLVMMGGHISEDDELSEVMPLGSMQDTLQTAEAHQQVLEEQINRVTNAIKSFAHSNDSTSKELSLLDIRQQLNSVSTSSLDMCGSLKHCLTILTQQEQVRKVQLQQEEEKSRVLQEALHVLAEEHRDLEQSVGRTLGSPIPMCESDDEDDDKFFECNENTASVQSSGSQNDIPQGTLSKWNARSILPAPMLSRKDFSVWTFLKQCIGKELSKITMPVIFNEPLSFLQRLAEYMEYGELLQKAAKCKDPVERMEYVAAFAVSSSAANWERVGKPFNPLLGETYELVREDLGFKMMCEQVSHHPPVSAFQVESPLYTIHGSVHPKLKFWGKSVEAIPKGTVTLTLLEHDEVYTWENVICCVHNIIVGKLWIEHYGTMEITNHKTGHKGVLSFKPCGWFGKDLHKIEGYVYDGNKQKQRVFYGKWTEALYSHDIKAFEKWKESLGKGSKSLEKSLSQEKEINTSIPAVENNTCKIHLDGEHELWLVEPRPIGSQDKYYSFTLFAMMLNDVSNGFPEGLALTDSRIRPDIRKLEEGDLDGASAEKHRLEEKQRAARKLRKDTNEKWTTKWFTLGTNPYTGKDDWLFTNKYWDRNWETCPDIF